MILICPSCRAPSHPREPRCWVCRRVFDGTEAVIGDVPDARAPCRRLDATGLDVEDGRAVPAWRRVRAS